MKYLALVFFALSLLSGLLWGRPTHWADGSGWVTGILAGIGLFILWLSYRNTGKALTDESGGH